MSFIDPDTLNLKDKLIYINRVAKVVKGGRRFSFTALVAVGDGEGHVGAGKGKANEVPEAIKKAVQTARKNLIKIPLVNGTLPHEILGHFGPGRIVLKPAPEGTGIIAGGAVRAIMEVAGVRNVVAKSIRSKNHFNTVNATLQGLKELKGIDHLQKLKDKSNSIPTQKETTNEGD
jgi:small subunit ribosomal protein S5